MNAQCPSPPRGETIEYKLSRGITWNTDLASHVPDLLDRLAAEVSEFSKKRIREHFEDINGFFRYKKMKHLRETKWTAKLTDAATRIHGATNLVTTLSKSLSISLSNSSYQVATLLRNTAHLIEDQ